jgi:hypothetical protein
LPTSLFPGHFLAPTTWRYPLYFPKGVLKLNKGRTAVTTFIKPLGGENLNQKEC